MLGFTLLCIFAFIFVRVDAVAYTFAVDCSGPVACAGAGAYTLQMLSPSVGQKLANPDLTCSLGDTITFTFPTRLSTHPFDLVVADTYNPWPGQANTPYIGTGSVTFTCDSKLSTTRARYICDAHLSMTGLIQLPTRGPTPFPVAAPTAEPSAAPTPPTVPTPRPSRQPTAPIPEPTEANPTTEAPPTAPIEPQPTVPPTEPAPTTEPPPTTAPPPTTEPPPTAPVFVQPVASRAPVVTLSPSGRPSSAPTEEPTGPTAPTEAPAGLSGGAIAGIVIGSLAAVAIIAAIGAVLFMKLGAGASGGGNYQQF